MSILVIIAILYFILRDDNATNDSSYSSFNDCTNLFFLGMFFDDE